MFVVAIIVGTPHYVGLLSASHYVGLIVLSDRLMFVRLEAIAFNLYLLKDTN